jgi:hypothetical protein
LQQLPAAIPGEVVDELALAVSEAVTNAILCGFLQHPAGQGRRRGAGGWIEATIGDRATPAPTPLP